VTEHLPLDLPGSRIHLIGAGGAGMSALAKILAGLGYEVSGSDLKPGRPLEALGDLGIATWLGHRPEAMAGVDLVVASSAVPSLDPEMEAARAAGVTVWMRPRLLEALTAWRPAIGLAGTHGKTTSTAMAVTALRSIGADPTFIVGGQMAAFNTGAHLGRGPEFVLEADEAFGTFRHLHLGALMVTNIEADHLDYYGSLAALEEAFALVARRVSGPVVACIDDPGVRRLGERVDLVTYGTDPAAAWRIVELIHGSGDVSFRLEGPAGQAAQVKVPKPGAHIARNAAGVLAVLASAGFDLASAASGLADFHGVRRRFEVRGRVNDITVVDDYAHHPTEIGVTIAAGRQGGWSRVLAVFQPHRYTRTANLGPQFGAPLSGADHVIVTEVYAADERPIPGVTGKLVAEAVSAAGGEVTYVPALTDVPGHLVAMAEAGDLVLLLGAGDITGMAEPLLAALGGEAAP
jgi:UDP-N-acetylmuramate--alanine ligase